MKVKEPEVKIETPLRMLPSCHVPSCVPNGSGFDEQASQGEVGVMAFQAPVKVKLGSESSTVVLIIAPLAKTAYKRAIRECGSHMSGRGGEGKP
jgi:hypothetical protein